MMIAVFWPRENISSENFSDVSVWPDSSSNTTLLFFGMAFSIFSDSMVMLVAGSTDPALLR